MLSIEETRRRIAALTERCWHGNDCDDLGCPGFVISESDEYGTQIERCDECFEGVGADGLVYDEDVAQLPEAQRALRDAINEWPAQQFAAIGACDYPEHLEPVELKP